MYFRNDGSKNPLNIACSKHVIRHNGVFRLSCTAMSLINDMHDKAANNVSTHGQTNSKASSAHHDHTSSQIGVQNDSTTNKSVFETGSPSMICCSRFCAHRSLSYGNQICRGRCQFEMELMFTTYQQSSKNIVSWLLSVIVVNGEAT